MSSTKPIVLFGCKTTTKFTLDFLLRLGYKVQLVTIDEEKGASQKVADYTFLKEYCESKGVEVYVCDKYSLKSDVDFKFFNEKQFDLGFVVGWQRLIPDNILATFATGIFGMHGSSMNLPKGRGRSPMNWSIIEGRKVFYTNIFKYKSGADDGDVLDTFKFQITSDDTGETMHFKNTLAMKTLILKNLDQLLTGNITLKTQPDVTPTYYPKRNESDSLIDWDDDVYNIERLIRAVTRPFNGAYTFIGDQKVTIYRSVIFDFQDFGNESTTPGEIVEVFDGDKLLIKGYGGLLLVHEYESEITPKIGDRFSNNGEDKKRFGFNAFGYHDLEEH